MHLFVSLNSVAISINSVSEHTLLSLALPLPSPLLSFYVLNRVRMLIILHVIAEINLNHFILST